MSPLCDCIVAEMNVREGYHAVMHYEPGVGTLRWEFGYWNATVERWYQEGLRRTPYSPHLSCRLAMLSMVTRFRSQPTPAVFTSGTSICVTRWASTMIHCVSV